MAKVKGYTVEGPGAAENAAAARRAYTNRVKTAHIKADNAMTPVERAVRGNNSGAGSAKDAANRQYLRDLNALPNRGLKKGK